MSSTAKSLPASQSKPSQPAASKHEDSAQSSETKGSTDPAEKSTSLAPVRLAFPLALTIVAVLPLALGIGSARLKASSVSAHQVIEETDEDTTENTVKSTTVIDRGIGDRDFQERRYEVALRLYRSLGSDNPERLPPEIQYRIALCQEGLGLWDEALVTLRSVSETADSSAVRAIASFGQARIWLRLNRPEQAELLLRSMLLHSDASNPLPAQVVRDTAFLIPLAMAQTAVTQPDQPSLFPVSQLLNWNLESAMSWIEAKSSDSVIEQPAAYHDLEHAIHCQLQCATAETVSPFRIDEWTADLDCHHRTIREVIERIAEESKWTIDWSGLADEPSQSQSVGIHVEKLPVWSLLTTLCGELHANWSFDDNRLTITASDSGGIRSREMIAKTLTSLAMCLPNHRFVAHARFAVAEIAQSRGDLQTAADMFATLVGRDSSTIAIRSAYIAAYNYLRLGDFARASRQLRYVVDGAPEQNLHVEALILLGRLLLDQGQTQDAIFQLRRATESRSLPDQQVRAGILLGLAYLTEGRYQEAAEAVFAQKRNLDEPCVRFAASFITASARWHAVTGDAREREAAFLYRSLIAVKNDSEWMGQTGQLMIGRAYIELGFDDLMADLYTHQLTSGVTLFIESEMTHSLADYELASGRTSAAVQLFQKLADGPANRWKNHSRLKLASIALTEDRSRDALSLCEQTESDETVSRTEILKTMGRAYEQLGEDRQAARCYAGLDPVH